MRYEYYCLTLSSDEAIKFEDFFQAVHFMNQHTLDRQDIICAQIWDLWENRLVCSKRVIQ